MGDPRQIRRKYTTPKHPWQSERLEAEKIILGDYSLKNKKEIWRMQSILKRYTNQAKKLANISTDQAKKEKEQLIGKLFRLGLIKQNADVDDVLSLNLRNILDRRLQTLVYKMGMANTQKQARQFIVHGHVFLDEKKMNVPSYLVPVDEETKIKFKDGSNLIGKFGKTEEEKPNKKGELLEKAHAKNSAKEDVKEKIKNDKPKVRKSVKSGASEKPAQKKEKVHEKKDEEEAQVEEEKEEAEDDG